MRSVRPAEGLGAAGAGAAPRAGLRWPREVLKVALAELTGPTGVWSSRTGGSRCSLPTGVPLKPLSVGRRKRL